jgi:hypothetical protein
MKAFPQSEFNYDEQEYLTIGGMDLIDYFATKALQGLISNLTDNGRLLAQSDLERAAHISYSAADAMMKAREMRKAREQ